MSFRIRAITLDLDDTLWPFAPIGARVEQVMHDWLAANVPRTAERFPLVEMRKLREAINAEHPHLAHDFSRLRKLTLARAMELAGDDLHPDPTWPHAHVRPDLAFPTLDALADWLDAHCQDDVA